MKIFRLWVRFVPDDTPASLRALYKFTGIPSSVLGFAAGLVCDVRKD